jgi:CheY-like chemotaxis protein
MYTLYRVFDQISDTFLQNVPGSRMYDALELILQTMDSPAGLLGFVRNGEELALLATHAQPDHRELPVISADEWKRASGSPLQSREAIIKNAPCRLKGRLIFESMLAVSIPCCGRVIGKLVAANKDRPYRKNDSENLRRISRYLSPFIVGMVAGVCSGPQTELKPSLRDPLAPALIKIRHDYNNLLAAIQGHAELALLEAQEGRSVHADIQMILHIIGQAKKTGVVTGSTHDEALLGPVQDRARGAETLQAGMQSPVNVLLVFHEIKTLDIVKKLLLGFGHRVTEFSDPEQAVNYFRLYSDQFDLVVGDGKIVKSTALTAKMRKVREDIPFILCMEQDMPRAGEKGRTLEAVIDKPVDAEALRKAVTTLLGKSGERG